jgi:hypothetical protein
VRPNCPGDFVKSGFRGPVASEREGISVPPRWELLFGEAIRADCGLVRLGSQEGNGNLVGVVVLPTKLRILVGFPTKPFVE